MKFYNDYLSSEDRSKILSEINQIHSQRFQLSLTAITAFGVFLAWIIPKSDSLAISASELLFVAPALLLILLFLFLYSHTLNKTQITLAAYLIETGQSKWEKDSKDSRGSRGAGFNYVHSSIFILLGISASLCPFIISHFGKFEFPNFDEARWILGLSGFVYAIIIMGLSYFIRVHYQKIATNRWSKYFKQRGKIF